MNRDIKNIPNMILIGSSGRNSGKTTLASNIINNFKDKINIVALKIISIEELNGKCQRGTKGCGICTNISSNFEITEEINHTTNKDTSILLKSGATKVYLLKSLITSLEESFEEFIKLVPKDVLIICESNSLRNVINPGVFLFVSNTTENRVKTSAIKVMPFADLVIQFNEEFDMNKLILSKKQDVKIELLKVKEAF